MIFGLFSILGPECWAASGTEGASFLDIPIGARPAALGSAYTALANDAYAPVWNPAALGMLRSAEASGQHLDYLGAIHSEFLSVVLPLRSDRPGREPAVSGIGMSAQYLGSGDIQGMDASGDPINSFSSYYAAYSLAYGRALTPRFSLGANAKFIEARLSDVSAHAFAGDLGSFYQATDRWNIAATLTNVGTNLRFLQQRDALPVAVHIATVYRFRSILGTAEALYFQTGQTAGRAGVEWSPIPHVALRSGFRSDTTRELSALAGFSTGVGLQLWGQEFAYAWLPLGDLGDTHYFSLVVRWGDHEQASLLARTEPPSAAQDRR